MTSLADAVRFGPDQPERFLTAWLGPARNPAVAPAAALPPPLLRWHEQVSRWGYASVIFHGSVPATRELDGDVLLVGVENQGVWLWGVADGDDTPQVVERENEPGAPWTATGETLDEYLWHVTVTEAVLGARHGLAAINVTTTQLDRFTAQWQRVDARPWRWPGPGHTLWVRPGALAWTAANEQPDAPVTPGTFWSISVGARSAGDLAGLHDAGIAWDSDSRQEPRAGE